MPVRCLVDGLVERPGQVACGLQPQQHRPLRFRCLLESSRHVDALSTMTGTGQLTCTTKHPLLGPMSTRSTSTRGGSKVRQLDGAGQIVILNGPPRSGKSSIAVAIQARLDGLWMNLGVDHFKQMTPARFQPGIGLRPGGERPDLEPVVVRLYRAMYEAIATHSRLGINVVVDAVHHVCQRPIVNAHPAVCSSAKIFRTCHPCRSTSAIAARSISSRSRPSLGGF